MMANISNKGFFQSFLPKWVANFGIMQNSGGKLFTITCQKSGVEGILTEHSSL